MRHAILAIAVLLVGQTVDAAPFYNSRVPGGGSYGTLTFSGNTNSNKIIFPDNLADALTLGETGYGNYMSFVSTNSGEKITITAPVTLNTTLTFLGATGVNKILMPDNLADSLQIMEGSNVYVNFRTTNSGEVIQMQKAVTMANGMTFTVNDDIAFNANARQLTFPDNTTWSIKESTNVYVQTVSTNNAETVKFGKPLSYDVLTSISAAGTTQGACTALTHDVNVVTTATTASADAVCLRLATAGLHQKVKNRSSAATIQLFPGAGGSTQLCVSGSACATADASVTIATNVELDCVAESATIVNCK